MPSPKKTKTTAPHTQQFAFFMGGRRSPEFYLGVGGGGGCGWMGPHHTHPALHTSLLHNKKHPEMH